MKAKNDVLKARPSIRVPSSSETSSASAKKMEVFGITLDNLKSKKVIASDSSRDVSEMFLLVQYSSLASFFATLLNQMWFSWSCPGSAPGCILWLALEAVLFCENCATNVKEDYLCERTGSTESTKAPFEVNTRAKLPVLMWFFCDGRVM